MRRVVAVGSAVLAGIVLGPLFLGAFVVAPILVGTGTVKAYAIPSSSMEPTLRCARPDVGCEGDARDRVIVRTRFVSYGRGDIVAYRTPPRAQELCGTGGTFMHRVVGLPGETITTRLEDGLAHVYVDGKRLEEPYVEDERRDVGPEERFDVSEGSYFVMGDNRAQSCDSRVWGSVPEGNLVGKVFMTYWPPSRISFR